MENSAIEHAAPHSDVYQINPKADHLDFFEAINKRLYQAEAITLLGMECDDRGIFKKGTAHYCFSLLNDLIEEIKIFQDRIVKAMGKHGYQ